jgi:hypothetical protein
MSCGSICWAAAEKLLVFTKRTRTRLKVCYRTCRGVRGKLQKPPPAYQGTSRPAVRPANPAASKYVCPSTVWLRNKVLRPFAAGSEDSMRRITSGSDSSAWRPRLSVSTRPVNLPFGVSITCSRSAMVMPISALLAGHPVPRRLEQVRSPRRQGRIRSGLGYLNLVSVANGQPTAYELRLSRDTRSHEPLGLHTVGL